MASPPRIVISLAQLFSPLAVALENRASMTLFLENLGWKVTLTDAQFDVINQLLPVLNDLESLQTHVSNENSEPGEVTEAVIVLTRSVFETISNLSSISTAELTQLPAPLHSPATWSEIALDLPEYLLLTWLSLYYSLPYALLVFGGVITETDRGSDLPPKRVLHWDELGALLNNPPGQLADVYGWGHMLDHERLLKSISVLAYAAGFTAYQSPVREHFSSQFYGSTFPGDVSELNLQLFAGQSNEGDPFQDTSIVLVPAPEAPGEQIEGLFITTEISGTHEGRTIISESLTLETSARGELSGAIGVKLLPDRVVHESISPHVEASLSLKGNPATPWILIGSESGARLELASFNLELATKGSTSDPELVINLDTGEGFELVIAPGDGDSFVTGMLGIAPLSMFADLGATWSSKHGFSFSGSTGFEVIIPLYKQAGPIRVDTLRVALIAGTEGATTELGVTGSLELGPFAVVVNDIGIKASFAPLPAGQTNGILGPIDLQVLYLPPDGVGLAFDIGPLVAGGYLDFDREKGEYAGVFDADLFGFGITIIGIITTQLEGNPNGWSLFLSLTATFNGLQIGFGFTLNGVGGLIGVNRGLNEHALAQGVRTGTLDSILFPDNPILNAPRIIADMATVFPPAENQFVFGPVVKIGWGTPTLIEVDLGIIIQLPDPITISLLGALECILPHKAVPIIELRVDVAGTVNLTDGELKVDASLRDSQVAGLSINGDMAIRASFFDQPGFLFSFGGFHPAFKPPGSFPKLNKLGVGIDTGDELRITLGGYFAVSPNTLQFGASCELWAKAVGFTADGGTSFDAMITFKPFGFTIVLKVWINVYAGKEELFGVLLAGKLKGPNRWHVSGLATFKLLGIKKSLEVNVRFGKKEDEEPRELIDVTNLLVEAVREASAWTAVPYTGDTSGVMLTEGHSDVLRVHPSGSIEVRQRIAPLDRRIDQYGNATLIGDDTFHMEDPQIGGETIPTTPLEEWFAPSQYWKMKDEERLSAPSFELMTSGIRMEGGGITAGEALVFSPDYEVKIRDVSVHGNQLRRRKKRFTAKAVRRRKKASAAGHKRRKKGPRVVDPSYGSMDIRTGTRQDKRKRPERYFEVRERIHQAGNPTSQTIAPTYEWETEL